MSGEKKVSIFWFRRDLRLDDNAGLFHALKGKYKVVPIFIFDKEILDKLDEKRDARVQFLHQELESIREKLQKFDSDLQVYYGSPNDVWNKVVSDFEVVEVYTNRDYEPYAIERDEVLGDFFKKIDIEFHTFKDHVIFEPDEVLKADGDPYVVFTPYSKTWLEAFSEADVEPFDCEAHYDQFFGFKAKAMPGLKTMGFESFDFDYPDRKIEKKVVENYADKRDFPAVHGTTRISMHLRFGTVSIRYATKYAKSHSKTWLNELIWRNFYQVIIAHFPYVVAKAFRPAYEKIPWRNDEKEFKLWCDGQTGYPIVDAGMRELNETGFMHNRVRMVVASFLTKHLLIDWRWGEAYFHKKLLDYELASNNGGWQWAAGTGCDAAPYFRIFNPELQTKKFDPDLKYINKWVPEYQDSKYPKRMVDHKEARERALSTYKKALNG